MFLHKELATFVLDVHNFDGGLLIFLYLADSSEHFAECSLSQKVFLIIFVDLKGVLVDVVPTLRNVEVV